MYCNAVSANSGATDVIVSLAILRNAGRERYRGRETGDMETVDVVSDIATTAEERGRSMLIRLGWCFVVFLCLACSTAYRGW